MEPYNYPKELAEANIIGEVFDNQTGEPLAKKETGWLKYNSDPDQWMEQNLIIKTTNNKELEFKLTNKRSFPDGVHGSCHYIGLDDIQAEFDAGSI